MNREQAVAKVRRDMTALVKEAEAFEELVNRDIIDAFKLRFIPSQGMTSQPYKLGGGDLSAEFTFEEVAGGSARGFDPEQAHSGSAYIKPVHFYITPWATLVALEVGQGEATDVPIPTLVDPDDPTESPVVLVDQENAQYYHPLATDLRGTVIAGQPRVGLVAFEALRAPTSQLILHVRGLKLAGEQGQGVTAAFTFDVDASADALEDLIEAASPAKRLKQGLEEELGPHLGGSGSDANAGCMLALASIPSTVHLLQSLLR